jgi:endoglucanase
MRLRSHLVDYVAHTRELLVTAIVLSVSLGQPALANTCVALPDTVPADRLAALSRGFNADGWIDGPKSAIPSQELLLQLRKAGMSHVRLPVPAEQIMRHFASQAQRDKTLRSLDQALKQLTSLGYSASVDLHPGERFNRLHREDPAASVNEIEDAWSSLAPVIRSYPADRVFAELLNEPDLDAGRWQTEVESLAAFVRKLLPATTLIVGPVNWQRADSLPDFHPLQDQNIVYAIHFYDPMVFTHQGHWDVQEPLHWIKGLPYPASAGNPEVQAIRRELQDEHATAALDMLDQAIDTGNGKAGIDHWLEPAVAWQQKFSRPIIVNEFGVLKASAPRESRLRWLSLVTSYAREHCWGWAHWELAQGFGLLDDRTGRPDAEVLRALLGPR